MNKSLSTAVRIGGHIAESKAFLYIEFLVIAALSTYFYTNQFVMQALIGIEILILVYLFIRKRWVDYIGHYVFFCGISLEFADLLQVDVFYSFKETRLFGLNLGVWALVPITLSMLTKGYPLGQIKSKLKSLYTFIRQYILVLAIAIVMGVLMFIVNDNNVGYLLDWKYFFISQFYLVAVQPIMLILIISTAVCKCEDYHKLEDYFECTLVGIVFCMVVSVLTKNWGDYGGISTLVVGNSVRWIPILLILPLYKEYKNQKKIWIWALIGMLLSLTYNTTGKTVLIYGMIPFLFFIHLIKNRDNVKIAFYLLAAPVILMAGIFIVKYLLDNSHLFYVKFRQAVSLIKYMLGITQASFVSDSPKVRIYEIYNIALEYANKPWLLLFGKGLASTARNYMDLHYVGSAFSEAEWNAGLFCTMHETFSKLFLSNGLYGIVFFVTTIAHCIKGWFSSPWIVLGLYWFVISYSYSATMTSIGLSCLVYGLAKADIKK